MSKPEFKSHKSRIFFSAVVISLVAFYIIRNFSTNTNEVGALLSKITPTTIIVSIFLALIYFYLRAISWSYLLSAFGIKANIHTKIRYWFFGEITRYIPGKVWSFVSRGYFLKERGVNEEKIVVITTLDIFLLLTVTGFFSLTSIIENVNLFILKKNNLLFSGIALLTVLTFIFFYLNRVKGRIAKIISNLKRGRLSIKNLAISILLLSLSWIFFGGLVIYIISILQPIKPSLGLFSDAILSWLIGFAGSISPTGLGVREGAIIFLFTPYTTATIASLVAISSRLILIVTEIINILFLMSLKRLLDTFNHDGGILK